MLYYLTSNESKFKEAQNFLSEFDIDLKRKSYEIPEIQAKESAEISTFSAKFATRYLNDPFFVMDRSFHIASLKGFPGPYVKYINSWFTEENLISLFSKIERFDAYWKTSIAYSSEEKISIFEGKLKGKITKTPKGLNGWLFDKFFIPETNNNTLAELSTEIRNAFWTSCTSWKEFTEYLQNDKRS